MPYRAETSLGTRVDYEVHKSPLGVGGVVAHWGEQILDEERKTESQKSILTLDNKRTQDLT